MGEKRSPTEREAAELRLLALVTELGNVSQACRRLGLDRSAYYRIRRVSESGAEAHPMSRRNAIRPDVAEAVLRYCLEFPEWGCDRLAHYLTLKGSPVSSPTVQKILIRNGLGRVALREKEAERRRMGAPEATVEAVGDMH